MMRKNNIIFGIYWCIYVSVACYELLFGGQLNRTSGLYDLDGDGHKEVLVISSSDRMAALIEFKGASADTAAIRVAGTGYYDGPMIYNNATNTTATSADIECVPVNATGYICIEMKKDSGWTG